MGREDGHGSLVVLIKRAKGRLTRGRWLRSLSFCAISVVACVKARRRKREGGRQAERMKVCGPEERKAQMEKRLDPPGRKIRLD